jgi:tRNA (cmo5U34)-methyltransferase
MSGPRYGDDAARRRALFYAESSEASAYDLTADLHTPQFTLMHQTLIALLHHHLDTTLGGRQQMPFAVLDIGSGTGTEAIGMLPAFPQLRLVALDLCEPMVAYLRTRLTRQFGAAVNERCEYLTADIAGAEAHADALCEPLRRRGWGERYDAVVSALALHHLNEAEKALVCQRIYDVLTPGGLFLNGDLFAFQAPDLDRQAEDFLLTWIERQFVSDTPKSPELATLLASRGDELRTSWLQHCSEYNVPSPIEAAAESRLQDDTAGAPAGYTEMLRRAGFRAAGCPFRFWQVGILWARR